MKFGTQQHTWNSIKPDDQIRKKIKIQVGGRPSFSKSFFGYNSASDCPIWLKFCTKKQNSMAIKVTWRNSKFHKFKMAKAAILQIVKSLYLDQKSTDFDDIWYTKAHFELDDTVTWPFTKFKTADVRHVEGRFLAIAHSWLPDFSEILRRSIILIDVLVSNIMENE